MDPLKYQLDIENRMEASAAQNERDYLQKRQVAALESIAASLEHISKAFTGTMTDDQSISLDVFHMNNPSEL